MSFATMQSDPLTALAAYRKWREVRAEGRAAERLFCQESFLSLRQLYAISELKGRFKRMMREVGFVVAANGRGGTDPAAGGIGSRSGRPPSKLLRASELAREGRGVDSEAHDDDDGCCIAVDEDAHAEELLLVRAGRPDRCGVRLFRNCSVFHSLYDVLALCP